MRHLIVFVMFVLAQLAAPGALAAQQSAAPPAQQNAAPDEPDYILGPGDVIEVDILGSSDFKTRARIRSDGTIALPFLKNVAAQGETPTSFAQSVAGSLAGGGYYVSPIVSVEVVSYASRYVIVLGAVGQPGLHPIDRNYRVSEIIARAGGIRDNAADELTLVKATGQELKLGFQGIATGGGDKDPLVAAGDKIFVPLAQNFYIYGQVNAPGEYPLKGEMTLRKAIGRSGGLTASGSDKRISVFRAGQKMKLELDGPISAGDVIVVGERFF
jgi:polysaccharide export outer membrane protein